MNRQSAGQSSAKKPYIHLLRENPIAPEEIEAKSFRTIDNEAGEHGFTHEEWIIVRRMIHTTADFSLMGAARFSDGAIDSACEALKNRRPIYVDSNMIRSGTSVIRLQSVNPGYSRDDISCHIADDDVAAESKKAGLPRSLFAIRKAGKILDGAIAVIGNAPVALLELNRMIAEDGVRPAVVIAAPVGFVHVVESKEELMGTGAPYIAIDGRRGGSPVAVSVIHSLCAIAADRVGAGE